MKQSSIVIAILVIVAVAGIGYWLMNSGKESFRNESMSKPAQEKVKNESSINKPKEKNMEQKNIVQVASEAGNFTTLVGAVKAAGLVETLSGPGPFTVLAPTDAAFDKLPAGTVENLLQDKEKLTKILTYHVIPGKVMAADVVKLTSAKTVQGQEVMIKVVDGKVMINEANVVTTDIQASNGVIHVIDSVIMPK